MEFEILPQQQITAQSVGTWWIRSIVHLDKHDQTALQRRMRRHTDLRLIHARYIAALTQTEETIAVPAYTETGLGKPKAILRPTLPSPTAAFDRLPI